MLTISQPSLPKAFLIGQQHLQLKLLFFDTQTFYSISYLKTAI